MSGTVNQITPKLFLFFVTNQLGKVYIMQYGILFTMVSNNSVKNAKELAKLLLSSSKINFEQVEVTEKVKNPNIILRSKDLEKYLPEKKYKEVYIFSDGEYKMSFRLADK